MRRREFITLLGSAAAWPLAARAQTGKLVRLGYLEGGARTDPTVQNLRRQFRPLFAAGSTGHCNTAHVVPAVSTVHVAGTESTAWLGAPERFFGTPDVARVCDFISLPVVAASPDRNQRATSKPTVTLTRNVSSPLAIGTGAAIAADPPCARIGTGGANPESSVIHSTRPSLMPDARA